MKLKIKIYVALLILAFVALGFYREYFFLNINAEIHFKEGYPNNYTHPFIRGFYSQYSIPQLVNIKWILTILFSLLFMGLTMLSGWIVHRKKSFVWYTIYIYTGLFIISGLSYFIGQQVINTDYGYRFSRIFMGFAQSPVPAMILVVGYYLHQRTGSFHNK